MSFPNEDFAKQWAYNQTTSFKIEYTWKIDQFVDEFADNQNKINSPEFSDDRRDIQFKLQLHSKVRGETNEKFLDMYLCCMFGKEVSSEVPVTFNLAFLDKDDQVNKSLETSHIFNDCSGFGFINFLKLSDVVYQNSKLLHENGQLHVRCKATGCYIKDSKFILKQASLLESGKHSDVDIVVKDVCGSKDTEIHAHKAILSAHSSYFETMFNHKDTKEAQEKKVVIPDVEYDVMKDFLHFIYTGVKPKYNLLIKELLAVAEKYDVMDLKRHCENRLSDEIHLDTVVDFLKCADLHNADKLKQKCMTFIASNFNQVAETEDWKLMSDEGDEIMDEITRAIAKIQVSKTNP